MRTRILLSMLAGVLCFGSTALVQTLTFPKLTPADEDEIREAVFRYEFEHNVSAQQQSARVYRLSLGDRRDPADTFIARFEDHLPPVKKVSQGKGGLIFTAGSIKQLGRNKVLVEGGYYEGGLSASGNTYTLERSDGKWMVTHDQMRCIS